LPLPEILTSLRQGNTTLSESSLAELSELDCPELAALAEAWQDITPEHRRDIVARLVGAANDNIALDFRAVFRFCLRDPIAEVRKEAVRGLWESEEPSLIEPLVELMETDSSEAVQAEAACALGRFALLAEHGALDSDHSVRVARALLAMANDDTRPVEVRQRALEAVSPLSLPEVYAAIMDGYEGKDDRLRLSSIRAMGGSCDPSWVPVLLQELGSTDADMRREAAEALGEIEEEDTIPQLSELIYDDDIEVQLATIRALGNIGGVEARESLKQCLDDPSEAVSRAAEEAIQRLVDREDMASFEV